MEFSGRAILLDIEGTTSSVSFVYDVMFPFVRRELAAYLQTNWGEAGLQESCRLIAVNASYERFQDWADANPDVPPQKLVEQEVVRLMDGDIKATGLKHLQGQIWKSGFHSGEMQAHVYEDVPAAINCWNDAGIDVRIYSSGSVQAQLLFFGHTIVGSLLEQFQGHYDTTVGSKRESTSYSAIAKEYGLQASDILFVSDVVAELEAARNAGLQTALCIRPGNATVAPDHGFDEIHSFAEIQLAKSPA